MEAETRELISACNHVNRWNHMKSRYTATTQATSSLTQSLPASLPPSLSPSLPPSLPPSLSPCLPPSLPPSLPGSRQHHVSGAHHQVVWLVAVQPLAGRQAAALEGGMREAVVDSLAALEGVEGEDL